MRRRAVAYALQVAAWRRLLAALCVGMTGAAFAHHSWSPLYDLSRSVHVTGTVTRVALRHPHSALFLSIANERGRTESWLIEWASPQRLKERGITPRTLRVGDELFVTGNPHRDPEVRSVRALTVRWAADGAELGSARPAG